MKRRAISESLRLIFFGLPIAAGLAATHTPALAQHQEAEVNSGVNCTDPCNNVCCSHDDN
jgi:hypothetical protein